MGDESLTEETPGWIEHEGGSAASREAMKREIVRMREEEGLSVRQISRELKTRGFDPKPGEVTRIFYGDSKAFRNLKDLGPEEVERRIEREVKRRVKRELERLAQKESHEHECARSAEDRQLDGIALRWNAGRGEPLRELAQEAGLGMPELRAKLKKAGCLKGMESWIGDLGILAERYKGGETLGKIAEDLGVNQGTLAAHLKKNGYLPDMNMPRRRKVQ